MSGYGAPNSADGSRHLRVSRTSGNDSQVLPVSEALALAKSLVAIAEVMQLGEAVFGGGSEP